MDDGAVVGPEIEPLIGRQVVVDVQAPYLYIGTLEKVGADAVVLSNADVHAFRDSQTTTELYLLETKKNGIRPNRAVVHVMRSVVVSISRLDDVILY